ncbi:hypothetical protein KEM48_013611 [Puccinia striiformis f. sp. tritici PST-130]|nr:hypothetical protein KEM48_013611 [Puccinia striiformis f. sp. tritici PST-130]
MGDSFTETKSPPVTTLQALPPPPIELNMLDDLRLDLKASEANTRLPHCDVEIGGIVCDTIVDSSAGDIYLDARVAQELLQRREITVTKIADRNVRLANGQIKKIGWLGIVRISIDNYEDDIDEVSTLATSNKWRNQSVELSLVDIRPPRSG